jgi:ABC-type branched-subunit amino acid transport system substrate-binding protein
LLEHIPEQRRASIRAVTPEQGAEFLQSFVDAGFRGFTFNNPTLPTSEAIARAGEVIKLMSSKPARVG